jgi:hypothetical protein
LENILVNDLIVYALCSADGGEKRQGSQGTNGSSGHEAAQ